ncbi:PaaI family thioesterase [Agrobacterium tumefaciens]|uniref:PaaI family thioesterase n=1 Tax=Agrobacterium tumefaciens TaxID=358 RepID=UPI0015738B97|nr:PaaI family thioesterase [Agrobacterium tumefaciens]NTE68264.1 PaaI family thioesterase [Agrobacterium tumefaciens]
MDGNALDSIQRGETTVPMYELIGLRVKDFASGRVSMSLTPAHAHANPRGNVAGGIIATALDTAAAWSCDLMCSEGTICTTIDLKVNFLRPLAVTDDDVDVVATALHSGSKIMVSEAKMIRKDGKLIAVALATLAVVSI